MPSSEEAPTVGKAQTAPSDHLCPAWSVLRSQQLNPDKLWNGWHWVPPTPHRHPQDQLGKDGARLLLAETL